MKREDMESAARGLWADVGPYDIHSKVENAVGDAVRTCEFAPVISSWLNRQAYTKAPVHTPRATSYAIKHEIERELGGWICHTTFLVVAYNAGVLFDPVPIVRANGLIEFYTNISARGR